MKGGLDGVTTGSSRHLPPIFCGLRFLERTWLLRQLSGGPFVAPPFDTCRHHLVDTWMPHVSPTHLHHVANDPCLSSYFFVLAQRSHHLAMRLGVARIFHCGLLVSLFFGSGLLA